MSSASKTNNSTKEENSAEDSTVFEIENTQVKLSELKVVDLKSQLEKRDLDKSGVKSTLIERLKSALVEEGENPEEYVFEIPTDSVVKSPAVKKKKLISPEENGDDDLVKEETEVTEEALQLSVEDEEAQFNEEENSIDVSLKEKEDLKTNADNLKTSSELALNDVSDAVTTTKVKELEADTLEKQTNLSDEKEANLSEKKIKATTPSITSEVSTSKVNKVIGKNDKLKHAPLTARSLCVTSLANTTRAADLKALFTKQGRVLSVKIVKSAKQTPGKCYGFVTMANSKDVSKAIQNLHRTELNGRIISVERTQSDANALLKKSDSKLATLAIKKQMALKTVSASKAVVEHRKADSFASETKEAKPEIEKTTESAKTTVKAKSNVKSEGKKDDKTEVTEKSKEKSEVSDKNKIKEKDKKARESRDYKSTRYQPVRRPLNARSRPFSFNDRSRSGNFNRNFGRAPYFNRPSFRTSAMSSSYRTRPSNFMFDNIREERLRQRESFRERERREAEKRRDEELDRHRFIERKQREEAFRLEREKERLRLEREILERERAEILRIEREKQILERERLERERDFLRQQAEIRLSTKRPFNRVDREPEPIWDDRKRTVPPRSVPPRSVPPRSVPPRSVPPRSAPPRSVAPRPVPPRYEGRANFQPDTPSSSRYELPQRERPSYNRHELDRPERYNQKPVELSPRSNFTDRQTRREVMIRPREDRQVYDRNEIRDRDVRRSVPSREPRERDRHPPSRREVPRDDWKHERKVHERIVTPSNTGGQRRMNYY